MTVYLVVFLAMFIGFSSGVNIVMKNGSLYHVYSQSLCYNEDYTFKCQNGNIVPVKNTFGLKPPEVQKRYHCTDGQHLPYPKECCQKNTSSDCLFDSSKDLIHVVKTCGYHSSCSGQKAGWTFIKRDSPVNCRYQSSMEDRGTLYTQYVKTEYICRDTSDDVILCPSQETKHSGKGIFLTSESYPKFAHKQTGFHCNCTITADNHHDVSAYIVDLRMCNEKTTRCGQRLNLHETPDKEIVTTDLDTDVGFKMVWNSVHKLQFTQTDGKIPFHLWLYFYANGTEMSITCQPPDIFTTTTTTTTPLPTTVKSVSTESPSVKNVTNKKKPTTATTTSLKTTTTATRVTCPAGCFMPTTAEECSTLKEKLKHEMQQQVADYEKKFDYIGMGGAALGGILLTSCIACLHSRRLRKKFKKQQQMRKQTVQNNVKKRRFTPDYVDIDLRSVVSSRTIDENDSASQVGRPRPKRPRHPRSAQNAPRPLNNSRNMERVDSDGILSSVSERTESKEELVDKIAEKAKENPEFENALMDLPVVLNEGEEAPKELKDVLRKFDSETLFQTLIDMDKPKLSNK